MVGSLHNVLFKYFNPKPNPKLFFPVAYDNIYANIHRDNKIYRVAQKVSHYQMINMSY